MNYIVDLATLSARKNLPYFISTWFSDLVHEDMNKVQLMDSAMASRLSILKHKGLLNNTLLIVMSDHGYR